MPLKLVCAQCGQLLYYVNPFDASKNPDNLCIPEILFGKLHSQCPTCGRRFTSSDIAKLEVKITGQPGNAKFYANAGEKRQGMVQQSWNV